MERQVTQPAADPLDANDVEPVPKKKTEKKNKDLETQAAQPPTSELVVALKALLRAEEPLPPQSLNDLMDHTLKDYQDECVEEGTFRSNPATEVGE